MQSIFFLSPFIDENLNISEYAIASSHFEEHLKINIDSNLTFDEPVRRFCC